MNQVINHKSTCITLWAERIITPLPLFNNFTCKHGFFVPALPIILPCICMMDPHKDSMCDLITSATKVQKVSPNISSELRTQNFDSGSNLKTRWWGRPFFYEAASTHWARGRCPRRISRGDMDGMSSRGTPLQEKSFLSLISWHTERRLQVKRCSRGSFLLAKLNQATSSTLFTTD